jgi:16S rRNA (cytidine1402-2'-O)-methyltransferase
MTGIQWSYKWDEESERGRGVLYVVPTPIGNLEDMTFRAVNALRDADYVACEDTRVTRKLLNHFRIEQRLLSCHEHNQRTQSERIVNDVLNGQTVAYVSDAGTPAVSDPGEELAKQAIRRGVPVIPLPGPSAVLPALIGSGLPSARFLFYGFLDRRVQKKSAALLELQYVPYTLVFYEAPHRLRATVNAMLECWGNRPAALIRELSKKHEQFVRGTLEDVQAWTDDHLVKGECCLVVAGTEDGQAYGQHLQRKQEPEWWQTLSIRDHVHHYVESGDSPKNAIKKTAAERGIPKREAYQAYHIDD